MLKAVFEYETLWSHISDNLLKDEDVSVARLTSDCGTVVAFLCVSISHFKEVEN